MITRRQGLQAAAFTALSHSRIRGANSRIQLALIGAGDRGRYVTSLFQKTDEIDLRAICDVYGARVDAALRDAPGAAPFGDHRRVLDLKQIDAVLIATPDHWHAVIAVDALNAGKDVTWKNPCRDVRRRS